MLGLEMLTARGILTKINSVMIPGVNDEHLIEVNKWVKQRGAFLHNVMPLISDPAHGTHYGLTGQRGPNAMELKALQDRLEGGAKLMRHCRQCRADAVGLLGEDRGQEFTADKVIRFRRPRRAVRQARNISEQSGRARASGTIARRPRSPMVKTTGSGKSLLVAVATKGGGRINEHFGHAKEFQVYEVVAKGANFVGHRPMISIAKAVRATRMAWKPSSRQSTTASRCWSPRSAAARPSRWNSRDRAGRLLCLRIHRGIGPGLLRLVYRAAGSGSIVEKTGADAVICQGAYTALRA